MIKKNRQGNFALARQWLASASLLMLIAAPAQSFTCEGAITQVGLKNGTGELWVSYGAVGMQMLCSVGADISSATKDTCRAWYALALSAQAQEKSIRVYYDPAISGNPTSCAGFLAWTYGYTPYFIELLQ